MICEQAYGLMSAKLDGALDAAQEEALRAHLEVCPDCRKLMQTMRGLDEQLAGLREPAPEGLKKGVLYRIDRASGKAKPSKRRWFGPGTAIGAVAAVLVLLVGTGLIPLGQQKAMSGGITADKAAVAQEGPAEANGLLPDLEPEKADALQPEPAESSPAAAGPAVMEPAKNIGGMMNEASEDKTEPAPEQDGYYYSGGQSEGIRAAANPVTEELRSACAALSAEENAAVLLYTEFSYESLCELLEAEEPKLAALLAELKTVEENGQLRCLTDCGTALAIHEWLLENLPRSELMEPGLQSAETRLRVRMEELDPGCGSLYKVISWAPRSKPIDWPSEWAEGWAARIRTEENWGLFFPAEDFVPAADAPALLVFATAE